MLIYNHTPIDIIVATTDTIAIIACLTNSMSYFLSNDPYSFSLVVISVR